MVLVPQSGEGTTSDNSIFKSVSDVRQNVQFSAQVDPYAYEVDSTMDSTRTMQDSDSVTLEHFFARPIKIAEERWSTSLNSNFEIDPWSLFFNNPRITNRLNNFNLLKANLRVKVVINGNGFHYGRMIACYLPFESLDTLSNISALVREDLVQGSQCPHIFLNPTTSTGGEMLLPMFNYYNYLSIPNAQWGEMGKLFFRSINPLKHANGATDIVTITVFAWAEDVSMSVLTSVDSDALTPQSGEIDEANAKGVVSGPATSVAKFAAYLKGVPYIGPFALATEIGGNAVAGMAKIFGYSRPPITKAPDPYRPTLCSSLALTNAPDVVQKLTVDDKQELTIDPRIAGIGPTDPLNIREIAKRESYLTTFNWNIGSAPDTFLWNCRVDPCVFASSGSSAYHFPACAFAALPFQYWKGTMKFRFQIVCSAFHKGRVKIVYDPNFISSSTYLGFSEYNTNYLKVVDIAEEQDFTVEVANSQAQSFLEHLKPGFTAQSSVYSTTRQNFSATEGNGIIGVIVVNELTTPSNEVVNDIEVNVFVSMGDDFEVAAPTDYFQHFVLKPQSGEMAPDAVPLQELDAPQQSMSTIIGIPPLENTNLNKVFMGEAIVSLRPLLKRYSLWNTVAKTNPNPQLIGGRFPLFPYFRGSVAGAVDTTAALTPYNYCNTILLHWIRAAYSGSRGSIRYKFVPRGNQDRGDRIEVSRSPYDPAASAYELANTGVPPYTNQKNARRDIISGWEVGTFANVPERFRPLTGTRGQAVTISHVNGSLEFEVPYYSPYRFTPGKRENYTSNQTWEPAWDYRIWNQSDSNTTTSDIYVAAGEDFQVYFFTGLPRMYYESEAPL